MKQTAEERAEARYQDHTEPDAMIGVRPWQLTRLAYATCIREEVEPKEAEIERLRALVQELGNALSLIGIHDEHSGSVCETINHSKGMLHEGFDPCPGIRQINAALVMFNKAGFVPTNTEDNG